MTTASAQAAVKRPRERATVYGAFEAAFAELVAANDVIAWPDFRYQADPVAFSRDVLGVELWDKQREILERLAHTPKLRVAVRSGHKCGKSMTAAVAALWFYCSFEDARVIMTSATARQVDEVLWREIRRVRQRARLPIDGDMHELARSGLRSDDYREIFGFSAREAEAVAGLSGRNMLFILDEASGIDAAIFEALEGNRASGTIRVLMISNPTQTEGYFFDAFHKSRDFWDTMALSSEETPNAVTGREVIPGLAGASWIAEKKAEWGENHPLYLVRVKGEFPVAESGKILSIVLLQAAQERWAETPADGPLQIGVDPAGPSGTGDETTIAARRGLRLLSIDAHRGLGDDAIVAHVAGVVRALRGRREPPALVCVDREGLGYDTWRALRAYAEAHPDEIRVVGVRASDGGKRDQGKYHRVRDELWASGYEWFRDGGAITTDEKLQEELNTPRWIEHINGKLKVTSKEDIREILGRSPDRADAVLLSVWTPDAERAEATAAVDDVQIIAAPRRAAFDDDLDALSPYGGGADVFNPYSSWGAP